MKGNPPQSYISFRDSVYVRIYRNKSSRTTWGHPWYSGSEPDCWSTGRAIDTAPGACFITKIHLISTGCPRPSIALQMQNHGIKHHSFIPKGTSLRCAVKVKITMKRGRYVELVHCVYLVLCAKCMR